MDETKPKRGDYWNARSQSIYLYAVRELVRGLGDGARSVVDIGSAACPYVDWFDWIPDRTSIDLRNPYRSPTVHGIKTDFLAWNPDRRYDLATCLQVLEHIPDVEAFARKILAVSRIAVVSVPFRWKPGRNVSHIHDPVDEAKMRAWFGREPNFSYRITELISGSPRLIQVYESGSEAKWTCINDRKKKLAAQAAAIGAELGPQPSSSG